jgi:DNA-binding PadR family transcriptional regulator
MPDPSLFRRPRSPEFALLGFLYLQPGHGYDLHRRLTAELGRTWHVSQSQAYAILKRLEARGEVRATPVRQPGAAQHQRLELTPSGRKRFEAWLAAPTACSVRAVRLEFITRLYFAERIDPGRVQPMIADQLTAVRATHARLQADLTGLPEQDRFNRLSLDLRLHLLDSLLDWLGEVAASHPAEQGGQ